MAPAQHVAKVGAKPVPFRNDRPRMGQEQLGIGGRPHAPPVAFEQAHAQLRFQPEDALAHRLLAEPQPLGGGSESAGFIGGEEMANLT